jgi:hypothetical protein
VSTPLDATMLLSKLDCPSVVGVMDPKVHRKYRSIVGCISYLVNMTRPDLAFSYSQLSKFLIVGCQPGSRSLNRFHPSLLLQATTRVLGIAKQALLAIADLVCLDRDHIEKSSNSEAAWRARSDAGRELCRSFRRAAWRFFVLVEKSRPRPAQNGHTTPSTVFRMSSTRASTRTTHFKAGTGIQTQAPRSYSYRFIVMRQVEEQFAITGVCATFPPDNTSKELRCPRSHYGTPYSHYTLISLCDSACMFA